MTEEIINADGSRNWEANILLDNVKRLEQENKELKIVKEQLKKWNDENLKRQDDMQLWIDLAEEQRSKYRSALEEIRKIVKQANKDICDNCGWHNTDGCSPNGYLCHDLIEIKNKINEVLNDN